MDSPPREPTEATLEGEALDQAVTGVDSSPAVLEQERDNSLVPFQRPSPPRKTVRVSLKGGGVW